MIRGSIDLKKTPIKIAVVLNVFKSCDYSFLVTTGMLLFGLDLTFEKTMFE